MTFIIDFRIEVGKMRHYRRRPKKLRLGTLVVLLLLVAVFLVSCAVGSRPLWAHGALGLGSATYRSEEVTATLSTEGDLCAELSSMVEVLVGDSLTLQPFSGSTQAVKLYRDRLLLSMLREHYALYNCNAELEASAKSAYPQRTLCTLIPKDAFESFVFRNFGGNHVAHKSGEVFEYLSKIDCYTSPVPVRASSVAFKVRSLVETERTRRMEFTLLQGGKSLSYTAIFLFRKDGSSYLYSIST